MRLQQSLFGLLPIGNSSGSLLTFLKLILGGAALPASLLATSALLRKVFRTFDGIEGDIFLSGTALLPFSALLIATALLGTSAYQALGILFVFALSYTILLLFCGYTRVAKMKETTAALVVPALLLVSGWLTKILLSALLSIA